MSENKTLKEALSSVLLENFTDDAMTFETVSVTFLLPLILSLPDAAPAREIVREAVHWSALG